MVVVVLILFSRMTVGEVISLSPCGDTKTTEKGNSITVENNCIFADFPKNYDKPTLKNKLRNKGFDLYIIDVTEIMATQKKPKNMFNGAKAEVITNGVRYCKNNGEWCVIYELKDNKFEASVELKNPQYETSLGDYWVQMQITTHEKQKDMQYLDQGAKIDFQRPKVDGRDRYFDLRDEGNGVFSQLIGRGTHLFLDPIYTVDYSPIPAEYLQNGSIGARDTDFTNISDVTSQMSDNNDTTKVSTHYNIPTHYGVAGGTRVYLMFDETSGTTAYDNSTFGMNATLLGQAEFRQGIVANSLYLNGTVGTSARITDSGVGAPLDINSKITMESWINADSWNSRNVIIMKDNAYLLRTCNTAPYSCLECGIYSGVDRLLSTSTGLMLTGTWYHIACTYDNDTAEMKIYLNNNLVANTTFGTKYAINENNNDLYIGRVAGGGNRWAGYIDELRMSNISRNFFQYYNGNQTYALSGNWNRTHTSNSVWFLRIRKTSPANFPITVFGYRDTNNISLSLNATYSPTGTGWFNIPITNIVQYETNITNLTYTKLRVAGLQQTEISELLLRREVNDTATPTVVSCSVDVTQVNCSERARFSCNITDDTDVDRSIFTLSENYSLIYNVTALQNMTSVKWEYIYTGYNLGNFSRPVNLSLVHAWDIFNQSSVTTVSNVSVLDICMEGMGTTTTTTTTSSTSTSTTTTLSDTDRIIQAINNQTSILVNVSISNTISIVDTINNQTYVLTTSMENNTNRIILAINNQTEVLTQSNENQTLSLTLEIRNQTQALIQSNENQTIAITLAIANQTSQVVSIINASIQQVAQTIQNQTVQQQNMFDRVYTLLSDMLEYQMKDTDHYNLQISSDGNFTSPKYDRFTARSEMKVGDVPLPDGNYYARVRMYDATLGRYGIWSRTLNFTVNNSVVT